MDAMEKKMTTELEKAIQEIERLRQENAQLRKKLGIKVSEPKSHYNQSGPSSVGPDTSFEETQEIRTFGGHGIPMSATRPAGVDSNFSSGEPITRWQRIDTS